MKKTKRVFALIVLISLLAAIQTPFISQAAYEPDLPSKWQVYEDYFLMGNVVNRTTTTGDRWELFKRHYNVVTSENDMKPSTLQNRRGVFTFDTVDRYLQQAIDAGMVVHGHTLVWFQMTPAWMFTDTATGGPLDKEVALENMRTHIDTVVRHFSEKFNTPEKKNIISWDVVNEAIDNYPDLSKPWYENLYEACNWFKSIGWTYIEEAFIAARMADPEMPLYYNEYNMDDPYKAQVTYEMIKDINERYPDVCGRPLIDGIGVQCHYSNGVDPNSIRAGLDLLVQLGLPITFSELDIEAGTGGVQSYEESIVQGVMYAELFNVFKDYSDYITRVTWWGTDDASGWKGPESAYCFDRNLSAKPAFWGVVDPDGFLSEHAGYIKNGVTISPKAKTFGKELPDYADISPQVFTIANNTDYVFNNLSVSLSENSEFEAGAVTPNFVEPGGIATFTVKPKHGLPLGGYFDAATLTGDRDLSRKVDVVFEVVSEKPAARGIDYREDFSRNENIIKAEWSEIGYYDNHEVPIEGSYFDNWHFNTSAHPNTLAYPHSWDFNAQNISAIAYDGGADWTDYTMEVTMRPGDSYDFDKGPVFRATDNNFYVVTFHRQPGIRFLDEGGEFLASYASFDKVVDGVRTTLAGPLDLRTEVGFPFILHSEWGWIVDGEPWLELKVEAVGDNFKVYVNDKLIFDITDGDLPAGSVGFIAGMGQAWYKDLVVVGPEPPIDYVEDFIRNENIIKTEWSEVGYYDNHEVPISGSYFDNWHFNTSAHPNTLAYPHSWDFNAQNISAIAYDGGARWTDYVMEVTMRPGDSYDFDKGPIFRATENNFYVVTFHRQPGIRFLDESGEFLASYASFDKVADGVRTTLAGPLDLRTEVGFPFILHSEWGWIVDGEPWLDLRVEAVGDNFKVYVNNKLIFDVTDGDLQAGSVGFIAGMGQAWYKDLSVKSFDGGGVIVEPELELEALTAAIESAKDMLPEESDIYPDGTEPDEVNFGVQYWLATDVYAFEAAIAAAEDVLINADKQYEIDEAVAALAGAAEIFAAAVKTGTFVDIPGEITLINVTNARFVSMIETSKNSRIWMLAFTVTETYSDGNYKENAAYSIALNGNNANQDGRYAFANDHALAGYTLAYDIKGNGSNIKKFEIVK